MKKAFIVLLVASLPAYLPAQEITMEFNISGKYLNIPVNMKQNRQMVHFMIGKDTLTYSVIRVADQKPDYWIFKDVSAYKGKTLKLTFTEKVTGLDKIFQSDKFEGQDSLYREKNRPQFHFSSRRGWNNDPNGLVWFDGEYHLFYQHNPYEIHWENMHWGHAVSPDLIHWTELNDALYPDPLGTMFSGSAVIDKNNTAGWGKDALVAAYTADKAGREFQCIAYSTDKGRTFTKYQGNPVVGPTRDPKVIWYEPNREWVMALYDVAGISFHTSKNLKDWKYESHINGFFECPELFQLYVDGDPGKPLWVAYGGSGTYLLGDFNGKVFTPRYGKYRNTWGGHYAAQTYNNAPDGKRIQIGWGQIEAKGMPFNQMMCFPTELTLRTTKEGIRMFSEPIKAIDNLHIRKHDLSGFSLAEANAKLAGIGSDLLHVVATLESLTGSGFGVEYRGNRIGYMDGDEINGLQFPRPDPEKLVFNVEFLIDRTSVESYYQKGLVVFVNALKDPASSNRLEIKGNPDHIKIHKLEVYELKSIW